MKIITEPSITIVGRPNLDDIALQEYLSNELNTNWHSDSLNDGEAITETAGRICYLSFNNPRPGGNKAYLEHIIEVQHGSVLAHATYNFIISGVSRSLSHEWVRHSAGCAISQLSQRYVDESVAEYVCPDIIKNDPELYCEWLSAAKYCHDTYVNLANKLNQKLSNRGGDSHGPLSSLSKTEVRKQARQAARSILPNATETKIFWSGNLRAIRNVIEQRCTRYADVEIRKLGNKLYDIMLVECPNIFADYNVLLLDDGTREITTEHRKV